MRKPPIPIPGDTPLSNFPPQVGERINEENIKTLMGTMVKSLKPLASLARRFATIAAMLASIAMLVIAGASWWQHAVSLRSLLLKDAELQAAAVSSNLREIAGRMSELANSPLIANALLDSTGKESYLAPYLNGIRRIQSIPVDILFADFEGRGIADNGKGSFSEQELNWLREKLPVGLAASRVQLGEKGEELLAVEFIVILRSNSVQGALLYRIKLDELALQGGTRLVRGPEAEQMLSSPTAIAAAVKVPPIYKHLDFAVLTNPDPSTRPFDWQTLGGVFHTGNRHGGVGDHPGPALRQKANQRFAGLGIFCSRCR